MSIKRVRNENFKPFIDDEGFFQSRGLDCPPTLKNLNKKDEKAKKEIIWHENLETHSRLYFHNTLSSARRHANFINVR